jgi:hypothetical protein
MTHYADVSSNYDWYVTGEPMHCIGWLHPNHEYVKGFVDSDLAEEIVRKLSTSRCFLYQRGMHECEFCKNACGSGVLLFPCPESRIVFISPSMLPHYITAHSYSPPANFIQAVLTGPEHNSDEYAELLECLLGETDGGTKFLDHEMLSRRKRKTREDWHEHLRSIGDTWAE